MHGGCGRMEGQPCYIGESMPSARGRYEREKLKRNTSLRYMASRVARRRARALSHLQPTGGTQSPLFDGG